MPASSCRGPCCAPALVSQASRGPSRGKGPRPRAVCLHFCGVAPPGPQRVAEAKVWLWFWLPALVPARQPWPEVLLLLWHPEIQNPPKVLGSPSQGCPAMPLWEAASRSPGWPLDSCVEAAAGAQGHSDLQTDGPTASSQLLIQDGHPPQGSRTCLAQPHSLADSSHLWKSHGVPRHLIPL